MTALANFLFPAPAERRVGAIMRWWESRRLPYNLIVGAAGLFSLAVGQTVAWIFSDSGMVPWQPVVAFGVLANVCYSLGPVVELSIQKLWGRTVLPVGPALFRMGLTFSVGLAFLPALIITMLTVVRIIAIMLGLT